MDETLIVRRVEMRPARTRRVTTQFAPERRRILWPWVVCAAVILAAAALGEPWDPQREARLATHANEVIRLLP